MATIREMRASVIAGVTEGRPTTDFPFPDSLVDHLIFTTAAAFRREDMRSKKGTERIEPWMLTRFECKTATLDTPLCFTPDGCDSHYYIDLNFDVLSTSDDIGIHAYIQNSMAPISYYHSQMLARVKYMECPPSEENPGFTRIGKRLYFFGGNRDFSAVSIMLDVAVSGGIEEPSTNLTCLNDYVVPIPDYLVAPVRVRVVQELLGQLTTGQQDLIDDGVELPVAS